MMDAPLTLSALLGRARDLTPDKSVATWTGDGWHRYTYADACERACQLAHALDALGVESDERVGTLATNHYRHLELYLAVPASGRSIHTINSRLPDDHLEFVVEDGDDHVLFVDPALLDRVERHADALTTVREVVVLAEEVPETGTGLDAVAYEDLLADRPTTYEWPTLDETREAGLCHTSGTTGTPKGVQHTHRALVLACNMMLQADTVGVRERDVVCPIVPMYHGYAWGYPYAATLAGSRLVLPGSATDPATLARIIETEEASIAAAVPTIWLDVADHLASEDGDGDISCLDRIQTGGSAVPESLIRQYDDRFDVPIVQGWGMTETAPLCTLSRLTTAVERECDADGRYAYRAKAGRPVPGIELRIRDDEEVVPRDGETAGEIEVRGPWVIDSYHERPEADAETFTDDGWLRTGDVATWDARGYVDVVDRIKDVIKSGGEWISSIGLENELVAHSDVREAAVVAVDHETWGERPFAFVVPAGDADPDPETLDAHLLERFPKWWLPDEYAFVESIPRTGTGKADKQELGTRASERRDGEAT